MVRIGGHCDGPCRSLMARPGGSMAALCLFHGRLEGRHGAPCRVHAGSMTLSAAPSTALRSRPPRTLHERANGERHSGSMEAIAGAQEGRVHNGSAEEGPWEVHGAYMTLLWRGDGAPHGGALKRSWTVDGERREPSMTLHRPSMAPSVVPLMDPPWCLTICKTPPRIR